MRNATNNMHPFEKAGLGKAPFTLAGNYRSVGPIKLADGTELGAPGQAMGTCDYCAQGIADIYVLRGSCGTKFNVGCDCVMKAWKALPNTDPVVKSINRIKRKAQKDREAKRIEAALAELENNEALRERLGAISRNIEDHPEETVLTGMEWMVKHAGHSGKLRTTRNIEKHLKDMETN